MKVVLSKLSEKYLRRLSEPTLSRIYKALTELEKDPPYGDIKKLEGRDNEYRLRIGKHRAIFQFEGGNILVTVITVRGQAYKER